MNTIDLHVHTTASDGSLTPEEVVREAKEAGLLAIAITDHDTADGYRRAAAEGERLGFEVVPGIEISTKFTGAVHILGYYIDVDAPSLRAALGAIVADRDARNRKLAELMAADGIDISYEGMRERFGEVIGRPHFAEILVEQGYAENVKDAFTRYVNKGCKYYLPRTIVPLHEAITIIREAGGIPVLAHPFQYRLDEVTLRSLIETAMASGLRGMECCYSGYSAEESTYLERLAEEYGLLKTGGSDFHGAPKPNIALGRGTGELAVPYAFLAELKEKVAER